MDEWRPSWQRDGNAFTPEQQELSDDAVDLWQAARVLRRRYPLLKPAARAMESLAAALDDRARRP